MFYFNGISSTRCGRNGLGFNPYFTGCSTSTEGLEGAMAIADEFQSLFYWMFYFN